MKARGSECKCEAEMSVVRIGALLMPDGRTTWTSREIGMTWSCIGNLWSACIRTPSSRSAFTGAVVPIVRRHDVHVRPVASCRLHRRRRQRRFRRQPYPNYHRRRATPRYVVHAAVLERMPRPWLVVEYSAHFYETTHAVLEFFHLHLASGDYIVVEDGVVKFLPEPHYRTYQDGPDRAFPHSRRRKGMKSGTASSSIFSSISTALPLSPEISINLSNSAGL